MAKMFYTIEEAAEKLKVTPDQIKLMASSGRLQQFRDRDKLMFKRDQVDLIAASGGPGGSSIGPSLAEDSGTAIPLASEETDVAGKPPPSRREDPRQATGVSVFDANEVEPVDPLAQTQVTQPNVGGAEEDLALDSVGSGSGLLDLTRESDDTSLGAELLDEIYPGSGETSDGKMESKIASSGIFESSMAVAPPSETGSSSGLDNLQEASGSISQIVTVVQEGEQVDPAWSGLTLGAFAIAFIALFLGLLAIIPAASGVNSPIAGLLGENVLYVMLLLIVLVAIGSAAGFFIGKSRSA